MCRPLLVANFAIALGLCGCGGSAWTCLLSGEVDYASRLGCEEDFLKLASRPLDASIPGARSAKTVVDRSDDDTFYVQNSNTYPIHHAFASAKLSGLGKPVVPALAQFNVTEYYSPDRRFLLGAGTHYEGPDLWVYEIAPYDNASADMISSGFFRLRDATYFGNQLRFHPTSDAVAREAKKLPKEVPVVTTDELFAGVDYQPLNLAESYGRLRFVGAAELATAYVGFREIVVLDRVPNDISVVAGIITGEFQTPLSHINVLSQNRGTPNMALRDATTQQALVALKDKWVRLEVGAFAYTIEEVTREQADAWWENHRPKKVQIPRLDLTVSALTDMEDLLDRSLDLGPAIKKAIPAFGGKASHYAGLAQIATVRSPRAFAVPIFYYHQFMTEHGFYTQIEDWLTDDAFLDDPATRDARLSQLRQAMRSASVDAAFEQALLAKLNADYPQTRMRFRSSTNAEDLAGFTGAGLYTSKSGDPNNSAYPVLDAVRAVWASVWKFRAFEERSYRGISHTGVGMALLVHHSFPDEEANGVALTANPFDTSGLEPGFYINVQVGEASVVNPGPGITSDQMIYHFDLPGQPITFLAHSNLVASGQTVLTLSQSYELGRALRAIAQHFRPVYGPPAHDPTAWYAMDVEFKFDDLGGGGEPKLWVKQARPHPGRGQN